MNRKALAALFVIVAGEAIFMLPFLIPRLYRPLIMGAWDLTNTDIGAAFTAYGISATLSYILGGPFADQYSPRWLISVSLVSTAVAALSLLLFPSQLTFLLLYFVFGISTILLMWGALIKVTHVAGGEDHRATAMGVLDAGRGLMAALMSSLLVWWIGQFYSDAELELNQAVALKMIYFVFIIFTLLVAVGVWLTLVNYDPAKNNSSSAQRWDRAKALAVLRTPHVWYLGLIVLSSYCGYKSIDNYAVYLVDVQQLSIAEASRWTSVIFWLRPASALLAGILADKVHGRWRGGRFALLFLFLTAGALLQWALTLSDGNAFKLILGAILASAAFAFALRAIYFAVFGDLKIPQHLVGTTVGIVSFVGFLPEMFFGLITGQLIDRYPGVMGFNYSFLFTAGFLTLGAVASLLLYRR